jgi:hypothetical protein
MVNVYVNVTSVFEKQEFDNGSCECYINVWNVEVRYDECLCECYNSIWKQEFDNCSCECYISIFEISKWNMLNVYVNVTWVIEI